MATDTVRSKGIEHTVNVVDKARGGATVTIDGHDETFDVEFTGGTGAEIAAVSASAAGGQPIVAATPGTPSRAAPAPVAAPAVVPATAPAAATVAGEGASQVGGSNQVVII